MAKRAKNKGDEEEEGKENIMGSFFEVMMSSLAICCVAIALIMLGGEPDIADAVRHYIEQLSVTITCGKE